MSDGMSGWRKLTHDELEQEHSISMDVVSGVRTEENPTMELADFNDCTNGNECLTCPISDIAVLRVDSLVDELRKRIPSATLTLEGQPGGNKALFVDLYKYKPREAETPRYGHSNGRFHSAPRGKPSSEWGMFLASVEMVVGTLLWYRATTGTLGF